MKTLTNWPPVRRWVACVGAATGLVWSAVAGAGEPFVFTTEHVDLRVIHRPAEVPPLALSLVNEDFSPPRSLPLADSVLLVPESARLSLPGDFPPIGSGGDAVWVIPASQTDGLVYLGLSAEGIAPGVFSGGIDLRLVALAGPGQFFLWQSELTGPRFWMNTRDGIDAEDRFTQPVGGHSHLNWGFTTSGVYRLTFQATARRIDDGALQVSESTPVTVHVLPLPAEDLTPYEQWSRTEWPAEAEALRREPEADPDGDQRSNLWEYFVGSDPRIADQPPSGWLGARVERVGELRRVQLTVRRSAAATDVVLSLQEAPWPEGPWAETEWTFGEPSPMAGGVLETLVAARPLGDRRQGFYRVGVHLRAPGSAPAH